MNDVIFSPIPKNELFDFIEEAVKKAVGQMDDLPATDELITREELKELTGIASDVTVIRLERQGVFNPIRLGRRLLYRKSDIKKALSLLQKR